MPAGKPLTHKALLLVITQATADVRPAEHSGYKLAIAVSAAVTALMMAGEAT